MKGARARRCAGGPLDARGVTLVELLVALTLLAVALVPLAAAIPLAMQAITGAGARTAAVLLAQQCIELAKSLPYDGLPAGLASGCSPDPEGYAGFTRALTVAPGPTESTTTVTVEVGYPGPAGGGRAVVATILSP